MKKLIDSLKRAGVLKSPAVIKAFESVDRADFVSDSYKKSAHANEPLPIGFAQTISQPHTVAFMLELLRAGPGQKVLDIGSGSGWTTALLAKIVGPKGHVWAVEIIPALYEVGKANLAKFNFSNLALLNSSGYEGYAPGAPFDRILVSAVAEEVPEKLLSQLAPHGRLVMPVLGPDSHEICLCVKSKTGGIRKKYHPGFAFVPLIKKL